MDDGLVSELDMAIALWTDGASIEEAIFHASRDELFEFSEVLSLISKHHSQPKAGKREQFSFTANSALSGGSHPCASRECRIQRTERLIAFAALYADEVYIQQPFEGIALRDPSSIREVDRHNLVAGIYTYKALRPLIEKGVVKYSHDLNPFCDYHSEIIAKPLAKRIDTKCQALEAEITRLLLESCSVTFNRTNRRSPYFEISGPEGVIEHGKVYFHAFQPMPSIFRRFQKRGSTYTLNKAEIEDSGVLRMVVSPIVRDITFQEWHTALNGTSYLCDNPAHIALVSTVNNETFAASSSAFSNALKHHLPQIYSRDPSTLLDLREREAEAFFVYRDKLRKLMQGAAGWNEKEVSCVFRDEIVPEINGLKKRIHDWKANARESLKEKLIFGTGAVTLGLYAGILPADIGQLVAALGGTSAAAGVLMDWNKTLKEKQQARTSDFYFLWEAGAR
jgi:hypothetical protein